MSRVEVLVQLYRLSLRPPDQEHMEQFLRWMKERQDLVDRLGTRNAQAAPDVPDSIERALLALIAEADRRTFDRLMTWRRRIAGLLSRQRGYGGFSAVY